MIQIIAGAVIAGGQGSRLGGEKPFTPFGEGTLLDAVIARAAPQVSTLVLNLPAQMSAQTQKHHTHHIVTDTMGPSLGPLAGIIAALAWMRTAGEFAWLASFPGDTPFLPPNLVATLLAAAQPDKPVFAHDSNRAQSLCALWPGGCLDFLHSEVTHGNLRSLYRAHEMLGSTACQIDAPPHAFFNVNTKEDLAEAAQFAGI